MDRLLDGMKTTFANTNKENEKTGIIDQDLLLLFYLPRGREPYFSKLLLLLAPSQPSFFLFVSLF